MLPRFRAERKRGGLSIYHTAFPLLLSNVIRRIPAAISAYRLPNTFSHFAFPMPHAPCGPQAQFTNHRIPFPTSPFPCPMPHAPRIKKRPGKTGAFFYNQGLLSLRKCLHLVDRVLKQCLGVGRIVGVESACIITITNCYFIVPISTGNVCSPCSGICTTGSGIIDT
jgi:hypothetical protein